MEEATLNKAAATCSVPGFWLLSATMDTTLKYLECESTNTKFCYYIYSLSQPCYLCETCKCY